MGEIPEDLNKYSDFVEAWISVACTHEETKEESRIRAKWENPHDDRMLLERILGHTCFVNSMPMMSGPQVGNILDPQEFCNKALETVASLKTTSKKSNTVTQS